MIRLFRPAFLLVMLLAAACRTVPEEYRQTGAPQPDAAVRQFLAAVRAQDLQAMSLVWGTEEGPARDRLPREELEQREIIMTRCIGHDDYKILGDSPGEKGSRIFAVELRRGERVKRTSVFAVEGPQGRWYVSNVDMAPLTDFCRA